jgi:hypothetical protein
MYNSKVWAKLHPVGLHLLREYCKRLGTLVKDESFEKTFFDRFSKQDGWYEFTPREVISIFGNQISDPGLEVPFVGNQVHLDCPF